MSLEDYFLGHEDEHIRRIRIFTDRLPEQEVLLRRLRLITEQRFSVPQLTDYRRPAVNVSTIFGEGGIGKSALLRAVADTFSAEDEKRKQSVILIDFGDFANHNFETVLMRLRGSLSSLGTVWNAFDLVFTHYWATKHPGVNLMRFIDHAGFLNEDQRREVSQQFTSILDSVLGGMGLLGAGYRLASALGAKVSEVWITRHLRQSYPPFELLMMEPDPETVLGYLGAALAYDWEQVREKRNVAALCLIDTAEYVQSGPQQKGSLEDLLARLIYLMPNMPFLVASRLRLNWAEDTRSATLTFGGPARWPELKNGAEGQLQLVGLDTQASDELLTGSLQVDGEPAMPLAVRERIVRGSYGLPLYLELSVNWYRQLLISGQAPDLADVGRPFPELVVRIMRDLTPSERDLIRAASIIEAFNEEVLATVLPQVRGSEIRRFVERSFIHRAPGSWLNYSLHQSLRQAIVTHDRFTADAWTSNEWADRVRRVVSWLEDEALRIWNTHPSAKAEQDEYGRRSVAALLLAASAAVEHGLTPARLGDLGFTVNQLGYRRAFESLPTVGSENNPLGRLLRVAHAIAHAAGSSREAYEVIQRDFVPDSADSCDRFVATEFARAAEEVGEYEEAADAYASLISAGGEMGHYGALGRAGNALRVGRLASALIYADEIPVSHPIHRSASLDLHGHIYLQGGEHARAAALFEESLQNAKAASLPLWVARSMRHVAHARMWFDPEGVLSMVTEAKELNQALGERIGVAQCEMASALAHAWLGDVTEAERLLALAAGHGADPLAIGHPWMVETLLRKAQGDEAGAAVAAMRVLSGARRGSPRPHVWYAVTALWVNRNDLADFDSVEWYGSAESARERWLAPLVKMSRALGTTTK